MKRSYYSDTISLFCAKRNSEILAQLVQDNEFALEQTQRDAWIEEIRILQATLTSHEGGIYFEYAIPRMGRRIDVAFEYSFGMKPHIVSLGAQANFALFASEIGQNWERNDAQFNELYFRQLIAKALLFRCLDRSVMRQNWYGGYKANIVTYSIAKLAQMVEMTGYILNLDQIWKDQSPSAAIEAQLLAIAELVNSEIQDTPDNTTNVTEWCKKEGCWQRIREARVGLMADVRKELVGADEIDEKRRGAEKTQKIDDGIHSQTYVLGRGAEYWRQVRDYALESALLSPKENGIIGIACQIPYKLPSERQSDLLLSIEKRVIEEGFYVPA
jgi:hypothetical protein